MEEEEESETPDITPPTFEQRIRTMRDTLHEYPDDISTREALARLYQEHGLLREAYEHFAHLRSLVPVDNRYCVNLGILAQSMGQIDQAILWYQCAIQHAPYNPVPHNNLGNCLRMKKKVEAAEQQYQIAIHLDPHFAIAHCNYGNLLRDTSRPDAAIEEYKLTLDADPHLSDAWCNLGILDMEHGNLPSAILAYRTVLAHNPRHAIAMANLVHCLTKVCDWDARDALIDPLMTLHSEEVARRGHSQLVQPYHALGYPLTMDETVHIARAFSDTVQHNANVLVQTHDHYRTVTVRMAYWQSGVERLRVAYLSSDFGNHPLSQLMQHSFGMHDRSRLEVYGYALSADDGTTARRCIERGMDRFFDVHGLTVLQIMDLIRCHRIHVLVDLNGYTRGAQPEILALRAAAVQIHYLGFCGTLGAPFVDYLITDAVATPTETYRHYTEKLIIMPHSYFVTDHLQTYPVDFRSEELVDRAALGLPTDRFVYACFNQLYKIDAAIFDVWMGLLECNPHTVLWLLRFPADAEHMLRRRSEQRYALTSDRLVFTPVSNSKDRYMRFIHCADLVLDTYEYNGHTTACDVLWAGVPMITAPGTKMASRVCASVLHALGCPELVCADLRAYAVLARRLATAEGAAELLALRRKVHTNRCTAPLFDTRQWVGDVEDAYCAVAERAARGLPPEHVVVESTPTEKFA